LSIAKIFERLGDGGEAIGRRTEALRVLVGSILYGVVFSYPIVQRLGATSVQNDWDFNSELAWVAYYTVSHFHQMPLWNPYKCGGMAMLGNPQSRFLTPFFILHLIFGPIVGVHLEVTLHLAIMWAGGYVLARVLGLRPLAAVAAATIFPSGSWFPLHLGEGQIVMLPFAYLPWLVALIIIGAERRQWSIVVLAGLICAIVFGEGGVLIFLYGGALLGIVAIAESLRTRSWFPIGILITAALLGVGLTAVKMIPAYELARAHPRQPWGPMAIRWDEMPRILFWRNQQKLAEDDRFFIEFGNYISPAFIALAICGIVLLRGRVIPWFIAAGCFLLGARGDDGEIPIWRWLKAMPLYSMMRLSSRFLIPLTLCVAVIAGFGVEELIRRSKTWGVAIGLVLIAAGAVDSLIVGTPFMRHGYDRIEPAVEMSPNFRQFYDIIVFDQTVVARHNMGMPFCYEYTPWKTNVGSFNQPGYRGEQYMKGPGTVQLTRWTPNVLEYEINAPAPTEMIVNQNYDPYWTIGRGAGELVSENGLLAVRVKAGRQHVVLSYGGWPWKVGALVTFATFLVAMWLLRRGGPSLSVHSNRRAI
jgi:hypothetical protein